MEKNIQFINAAEGFENQIIGTTGAVIIGDRTFGLTSHPYQYDLAEEWQNFTGLPFVFACWVSNVPLEEKFINEFNNALSYGVNNIEEAVIEKPNKALGDNTLDYLKNKISYNLDADKRKALDKFLELMNS